MEQIISSSTGIYTKMFVFALVLHYYDALPIANNLVIVGKAKCERDQIPNSIEINSWCIIG
jgi:hypothetical protein